ncbi:CDC42 small effector protein 1 isoform X1 [Pantherophis guttatus]|uniref:CDC42 small effector protein 1 isoform X1 n=1 Tax=Pantherophis guttatus TaxID=94885 RepID=A0ABM3ZPD3_PANGU|nr:CDC42 small effector protein 1 isoform X1 [Pantherophis guttatus]
MPPLPHPRLLAQQPRGGGGWTPSPTKPSSIWRSPGRGAAMPEGRQSWQQPLRRVQGRLWVDSSRGVWLGGRRRSSVCLLKSFGAFPPPSSSGSGRAEEPSGASFSHGESSFPCWIAGALGGRGGTAEEGAVPGPPSWRCFSAIGIQIAFLAI